MTVLLGILTVVSIRMRARVLADAVGLLMDADMIRLQLTRIGRRASNRGSIWLVL